MSSVPQLSFFLPLHFVPKLNMHMQKLGQPLENDCSRRKKSLLNKSYLQVCVTVPPFVQYRTFSFPHLRDGFFYRGLQCLFQTFSVCETHRALSIFQHIPVSYLRECEALNVIQYRSKKKFTSRGDEVDGYSIIHDFCSGD